jgi:endonuclease/exonuclease/phosphatase family metal-dependent hydrolase
MNSVDKTDYNKNIKILSYNVFLRPPGIASNYWSEGDLKDERINGIANVIKDYDIVMFQELFNISLFGIDFISNRLNLMIEIGKKMGFKYYVSPNEISYFNISLVNSGLLILSKYPILESDCIKYQDGYGFDMMAEKGILYAKIAINLSNNLKDKTVLINVFNTHVQSGDLYEETFVRWKQLKQLINYVHNKVSNKETILVGGDLNLDSINNVFYNPDNSILLKGTNESNEYKAFYSMLSNPNKVIKRVVIDCLSKSIKKHNDSSIEDYLLFGKNNKNIEIKENFYNLPFFNRQRKQYYKQSKHIKKHPITTFGHTEIGVCSDNELEPNDILRSLDYIFLLPPVNPDNNLAIELVDSEAKPYLNIPKSIKMINDIMPKCLALSDHYAIHTEIKITIPYNESDNNDNNDNIIEFKEHFESDKSSNIIITLISIILLLFKAVIVSITLFIWHIPYKLYLFMLFVLIYYYH